MEGVALVGVVDQSPFLDVAELHLDIDTVHRKLFAVEIELRLCIRLGHRRCWRPSKTAGDVTMIRNSTLFSRSNTLCFSIFTGALAISRRKSLGPRGRFRVEGTVRRKGNLLLPQPIIAVGVGNTSEKACSLTCRNVGRF